MIEVMKQMKPCSKCKIEKLFFEFSADKSRKDGYCPQCKACQCETRSKNLEGNRARAKAWRIANPERKKENDANWKRENRERVRKNNQTWETKNPKSRIESKRRWRKANPDKVLASCRRSQAAKLKATPLWADHFVIEGMYELARIFRRAGLLLDVDHIIPLRGKTVCGLHSQDNLQLLSRSANASKQNKWLEV
jgi:hypothetical protein